MLPPDPRLPERMIEQDFFGVEIDNSDAEGEPIDFTPPPPADDGDPADADG